MTGPIPRLQSRGSYHQQTTVNAIGWFFGIFTGRIHQLILYLPLPSRRKEGGKKGNKTRLSVVVIDSALSEMLASRKTGNSSDSRKPTCTHSLPWTGHDSINNPLSLFPYLTAVGCFRFFWALPLSSRMKRTVDICPPTSGTMSRPLTISIVTNESSKRPHT